MQRQGIENIIPVENETSGLKMQHQGRKCNIKIENDHD